MVCVGVGVGVCGCGCVWVWVCGYVRLFCVSVLQECRKARGSSRTEEGTQEEDKEC